MSCLLCRKTKITQTVEIIDVSEVEPDSAFGDFCIGCLKKKQLFCETHKQPKMVIMYPCDEDEATIGITGACLHCCAEKTRALHIESVSEYSRILREQTPDFLFPGLMTIGLGLSDEFSTAEQNSLFAVVLMGELFGRTVVETVTDLVVNGEVSQRN